MTGARVPRPLPRSVEWPLSLVLLVATLPVLAAAALWIRLDSPGPVLFRQVRAGRGGRPFTLLKLRTMTAGAGPDGTITVAGDARITRAGRLLRRWKIDELPQLFNVVRGDLGLVGPRPELPALVDPADPGWQAALAVRPGITDPVSLALRHEEEILSRVEDPHAFYRQVLLPWKLRRQLDYLARRTPLSDLLVIVSTALSVVGRGPQPADLASVSGAAADAESP